MDHDNRTDQTVDTPHEVWMNILQGFVLILKLMLKLAKPVQNVRCPALRLVVMH